jgi:hypothetical protein
MSLHSGNDSKHLSKNEDKTLIELSLFTELIKDESVIDSMIRALRYERNQKISSAGDRTTVDILSDRLRTKNVK